MRHTRCRRRGGWLLGAAALALVLGSPSLVFGQFGRMASRTAVVIENARIVTGSGEVIEDGTIVLRRGRIARISTDAVEVDGPSTVIDGRGMTVTPGFIDVHGTLALAGGGSSGPTQTAADAFDRYDERSITEAYRNGVTMVYLPAPGGTIGGTGAVIRLSAGANGHGEVVDGGAALHIDFGSGGSAMARLNRFEGIRAAFKKAKGYREAVDLYKDEQLPEYEKKLAERAEKKKKEEAEKKDGDGKKDGVARFAAVDDEDLQVPPRRRRGGPPGQPSGRRGAASPQKQGDDEIKKPREPGPDRDSEVLLKAIDRELQVRIAADRASDILNALDLAKEYGLDIVIEGGNEAALVAGHLAEAKVPVVLGQLEAMPPYTSDRARQRNAQALRTLTDAGVQWVLGTGMDAGDATRFVLMNAQLAARHADVDPIGLVTADAAGFLGLQSHGALRRGAAADLVLWDGDPLEPASRVQRVYVGGELVFSADEVEE